MSIYDLSSGAIVLHDGKYRAAWNSNKPTIVFIHAKWCGYCKRTMPEFIAASGMTSSVAFATLEDVVLKEMKNPIPVSGFPTFFKVGSDGVLVKIDFPREKSEMIKFINNM